MYLSDEFRNEEFHIGQRAVYPSHGLGTIEMIQSCSIEGEVQEFYVLKIHASGVKVMVPRRTAQHSGLRNTISVADVQKVYRILRSVPLERAEIPWNRRVRLMTNKLNSGNVLSIAEVLRDLAKDRDGRALGYCEKKMFEKGRDFLIGELASVCACEVETVKQEIARSLNFLPANKSEVVC